MNKQKFKVNDKTADLWVRYQGHKTVYDTIIGKRGFYFLRHRRLLKAAYQMEKYKIKFWAEVSKEYPELAENPHLLYNPKIQSVVKQVNLKRKAQ